MLGYILRTTKQKETEQLSEAESATDPCLLKTSPKNETRLENWLGTTS